MNALTTFAGVAEEYCAFIDSLHTDRPSNLYDTLEALLPRLHSAILPVKSEMASKEHPKFEKLRMTTHQECDLTVLSEVFAAETTKLSEWHESLRGPNEIGDDYCATRAGQLRIDLADIYGDLRYGLALWELATPDAKAEAAWEWRFGYETHWGFHLFRAMATVHEIRYIVQEDHQ